MKCVQELQLNDFKVKKLWQTKDQETQRIHQIGPTGYKYSPIIIIPIIKKKRIQDSDRW
jgi:hypothetical protein